MNRFLLILTMLGMSVFTTGARVMADDSDARPPEITESEDAAMDEQHEETARTPASWLERIRLSGSANMGVYGGERNNGLHPYGFKVWDARLFTEVDLGSDVTLGKTTVVRNIGAWMELELVRLGHGNTAVLREAYVDFQGLWDSDWLNAQVGRFEIPLGESYLRYSGGYKDNPFITNTLGGPWWWDEGVRFFGHSPSGRFSYVASISDGEMDVTEDRNHDKQATIKLGADVTDWLHLSASAARTGKLGPGTTGSALWLGEAWARPFGAGTTLANLDHGVAIADGPTEIENVTFYGGDAVLHWRDHARLWLAGGRTDIRQGLGNPVYDRKLDYWVAELVLEGNALSSRLKPFYLGLRGDGFGTYDDDRGYLLNYDDAATLGYNTKSITAFSIAPGWRMTDYATLRAEYKWMSTDLIRGATSAMRAAARERNSFGLEVAVHF